MQKQLKAIGLTLISLLLVVINVDAQNIITVCEQTIKIGSMGEEIMYFGFAAGDQINFEFESDKELKEIQIFELIEKNSSQKYSNFKSTSAKTSIYVPEKAVYQFRFKNGAVGGRICNVKIQRVPESEATQRFNTTPRIKTLYDTTYTHYTQDSLVGYDTLRYYVDTVRWLRTEKETRTLVDIQNTTVELKSDGIIYHDDPRGEIMITLPQNENTKTKKTRVIAWEYTFICEPMKSRSKTTTSTIAKVATKYATSSIPVVGRVVSAVTDAAVDAAIPTDPAADAVRYAILKPSDKVYFSRTKGSVNHTSYSLDYGYGVKATKRFYDANQVQGTYFLMLRNENISDRIRVSIGAMAELEVQYFEPITEERVKITPRYVTLQKKRMVVNSTQVRVPAE